MWSESRRPIRVAHNLSPEQWSAESKRIYEETVAGKLPFVLPEGFSKMTTDYGVFIQIQMNCLLNESPGIFIRTNGFYGPLLKVMIPKEAKAGDTLRIIRMSQSGKSAIAKIESVA